MRKKHLYYFIAIIIAIAVLFLAKLLIHRDSEAAIGSNIEKIIEEKVTQLDLTLPKDALPDAPVLNDLDEKSPYQDSIKLNGDRPSKKYDVKGNVLIKEKEIIEKGDIPVEVEGAEIKVEIKTR